MQTLTPEEFREKYGTEGLTKVKQVVQSVPKQKSAYLKASQAGSNWSANAITEAAKGGFQQSKQGYEEAKNAKNVGELLHGSIGMAEGAIGAAFSPLAPAFKPIGSAVNYVGDKISNIPAVQKFAMSPAGEATQRGVETLSGLNTIAGAVTGTGGVKKLPNAPEMPEIPKPNVKPVLQTAGRALKSAGESSYGVTVTPSEMTNRAVASYKETTPNLVTRIKQNLSGTEVNKPITEANTAARYGLIGTEKEIGVQAGRYMKDLWTKKVQPTLASAKGTLDMRKFFGEVEKEIRAKTPELGRRNALLEGLEALKSEYTKVNKIKLEKLQEYKEGWAKTLPESIYKGKPIASALKEVKTIAASKARDFIYKNAGETIKQDYIDYGNLKSIREAGIKSGVGDPAKKSISRGAWQFVMDKAITPVATTLGKVLYKTGEGLEFIGEPGAKTVGDIVENSK